MKTKINIIKKLFGAFFSLLVTFALTHSVAAEDRIVFYAPVIATNVSQRTHTVSYMTNNQILTMDVDGGNVRQLTTGTVNCFQPRWDTGQQHILFFRESDLYVM